MRRLARHLFTLCPAASLLVFVAVCVLWMRSHSVADVWAHQRGDVEHEIRSDRGRVAYKRLSDMPSADDESWRWETEHPIRGSSWAERLGFGSDRGTEFLSPAGGVAAGDFFSPLKASFLRWWVPYWSLAALAAIVPLVAAVRAFRRRTSWKVGLCRSCGYDLRATPDRCPECGAATRTS